MLSLFDACCYALLKLLAGQSFAGSAFRIHFMISWRAYRILLEFAGGAGGLGVLGSKMMGALLVRPGPNKASLSLLGDTSWYLC